MQLVLCNNRIVAHGENFLSMGGVVVNTVTGARYENSTIAECNGGCPSDIDEVGYEYHAGVFVPCAPYGKGNNNGYFMEVCESCATPRSSGIPIKGGLSCENLGVLLWENASPNSDFPEQTIGISRQGYLCFFVILTDGQAAILNNTAYDSLDVTFGVSYGDNTYLRTVRTAETGIYFSQLTKNQAGAGHNSYCKPAKIYGVKL